MSTKIAAVLALLLALSGVALYKQIQASGELQAQIEQSDAQLLESARKVGRLTADIADRDKAITKLEAKRDELSERTERVRTIVREVYVQPDVQAWAKTAPPPAVVGAVSEAMSCLWGGNAGCNSALEGGENEH